MFHQEIVGHFDPREGVDYSTRPATLRPSRPISRDVFARTLAPFDPAVAHCVSYCAEGWAVCDWTGACCLHGHRTQTPHRLSDTVRNFARTLAENDGAVVMTEMYIIWFPNWAKRAQEDEWARMARERDSAQPDQQ